MASPNFYNENRGRAYPFLKNSVGSLNPADGFMRCLPNGLIVDCGFTMGLESQFGYTQEDGAWVRTMHYVYLRRIAISGSTVTFEFASDAPQLAGYPLVFTRDISDGLYAVEDVESAAPSESGGYPLEPCEPPMWSGFLVTGDLSELVAWMGDQDEVIRETGDAIVEPALIHNLSWTYVNDISLANEDRTRATAPDDCPEYVWPFETGVYFVMARCIQGNIRWQEGYNCKITQSTQDNSITITAGVGEGAGEPCEEIPLFDGETGPEGSTNELLAGGPLCNETLRSINGRGGPMLSLIAGPGVSIVSDPDNHKITIDVNMLGMALCFSEVSEVSESL